MPSGWRELNMTAESLFKFLQKACQPAPLRVDTDPIPPSAALSGVEVDGAGLITLTIFDQWRNAPDPKVPLEIIYSQKLTNRGNASDWGTPVMLTEPRSSGG